jgi:hypothetical protein
MERKKVEEIEKRVRERLRQALLAREGLEREFENTFLSEGMLTAQELGAALRESDGRVEELHWVLGELLLEKEE